MEIFHTFYLKVKGLNPEPSVLPVPETTAKQILDSTLHTLWT